MIKYQDLIVRPCFEHDLDQVRLIYGHHVMTGTGTFEIDIPSLADMQTRWRKVVAGGWPFVVAAPQGDPSRLLGFAYAAQYRDRAAYAHTAEDSVYVAPGAERRGVGFACLASLLMELQRAEARQVVAVIGDSANAGSIGLHERLGFRHAGVLGQVGYKFGRWLDVVLMQRSLDQPILPQSNEKAQ